MKAIGVDIGGMSVKVGLVDENGFIIQKNVRKTAETPELVLNNIVEQINELLISNNITIEDIRGIGVGSPGLISSDKGIVDYSSNLKWDNVKVVKILSKAFNTNIKLSNDANVAALGETIYGAAKGYKNSVMLTLGTGVGGGVVIEGKLFEGWQSKGAELGHVSLNINGDKCSCGRRGCLEVYASATGLINQTKEQMLKDNDSLMWDYVDKDINKVNGLTAFECEKKGDASAKLVVDNYVSYLSEGILNMLNIFRPQVIIIGGGISGQGDNLRLRIVKYLEEYNYGYVNAPKTEVLMATLGNDAGIIGASALV